MVARGILLGADQPVILHLLDIEPAAEALNGVRMELVDSAFPLLKGEVAICWTLQLRVQLLGCTSHEKRKPQLFFKQEVK